jgi:FkbM family methyltransferase
MNKYYSQCGEDKYIYEKYFQNMNIENPIYFEAGALDGIKYSNTKFFEETLGWNGVLVEPNPIEYKKLIKNRNEHNFFYNTILSNSTEELDFIYVNGCHAAVSGITSTLPSSHYSKYLNNSSTIEKKMKPISLDKALENVSKVDFFVLDVEGHELEVLQSFSFNKPIYVMMVENLDVNDIRIRNFLESKSYKLVEVLHQNEIYMKI